MMETIYLNKSFSNFSADVVQYGNSDRDEPDSNSGCTVVQHSDPLGQQITDATTTNQTDDG